MRYWTTLALLGLLVSGCKHQSKPAAASGARPQGPPPVFDAVVAKQFAVSRSVEAPGTILPNESTDIHPEISGKVVSINFKEGGYVQAGTLLVKLFDADLQAQLKKLEVQLKVGEATERRQKELLAINGTSQQDYDNATLNVSNIKADIELLKVNISRTEIRAPYAGKLGLRNISLGAYVTPQTIITNLAQVNQVKAEFAVPEKYAAEMAPGKVVQMRAEGSDRLYVANVVALQNSIAQDTRNLMVRALVKNADNRLTPGAFVNVKVDVGSSGAAIMIPTNAIIPNTRNKNVIVARQGKAVFQIVNTGFRDSARIEITDGLMVGDTVITTGLLTIKEGMPLKTKVSAP